MKLLMRTSFLIGILTFTVMAHAGTNSGGGGKGIVCRDEKNNIVGPVVALDTYEAKTRGIKIDLGAPEISVDKKLEIALGRLAKVGDTHRVKRYAKSIKEFFSSEYTIYLPDTTLTNVNDSFELSFPKGCAPEQVVIQKEPEMPEERFYTISQDLWDKMDNDNKTIMVLHEIVYKEARYFDATNSKMARYFVSYIGANKLQGNTLESYAKLLLKFGFESTSVNGFEVLLVDPEVYSNYFIIQKPAPVLTFNDEQDGTIGNVAVHLAAYTPEGNVVRLGYSEAARARGQLVTVKGVDFNLINALFYIYPYKGYGLVFYANGKIKRMTAYNGPDAYNPTNHSSPAFKKTTVDLVVDGRKIVFKADGGSFHFHENGNLKAAQIQGDQQFLGSDGKWIVCKSGATTIFSPDEQFLGCK